MTISSTNRKAGPFIGNGSASVFAFSFRVFAASDLEVVRITVATGVETTLIINSAYTVSLNADQNSNPGGSITLTGGALSSGYNLIITSDIANLQPTDLTNQGGFYPEVITGALDRATIQIQQLYEKLGRSISYPITDSTLGTELPSVDQRKGKALSFDSLGNPIAIDLDIPSTVILSSGIELETLSNLIADVSLSYSNVTAGQTIYVRNGSFMYMVAAASAVSYHILTAGGVKLNVQPGANGYNVRAFGAVGDGVTDDTAAINAALTAGSVFIPASAAGYVITDALTMSPGTTLTGQGYNSLLKQGLKNKNAVAVAHDTTVRGIRVKMVDGDNSSFMSAIHIDGKVGVIVENNWLELADLGVSGVSFFGASGNVIVRNNFIYGGKWSTGAGFAASSSDIMFYSLVPSSRIVIDGNYCLSNNSQAIFADGIGYNAELVITNNICVTLDPATCVQGGAWSEIANGGVRRHGIVIGYNTSSVGGPRSVVSNNLCRNTRWTGIYVLGASVGRLVSNNVCSLNGYEAGNTLSGGLYIQQSGNELIEGNIILGFQNTSSVTGAITVNAPSGTAVPCVLKGNFIRDSLGTGICLTTYSALVELSSNTLIGNAGSDISVIPSAGSSTNAGHHIVGNRISRTSGSAVPAISLDKQDSTRVFYVENNRIRGNNNTTNNVSNTGIVTRGGLAAYVIKNNTIDNFYFGLTNTNYQSTNRDAQIEGNLFQNCSIGIAFDATTGAVTVPVVNNRFVGMLSSALGGSIGGAVAARVCTREGTRLVAHDYSAEPTTGAWEVGDRASFNTPVAGGNIGAVCVTAGAPGTWKTYGGISA